MILSKIYIGFLPHPECSIVVKETTLTHQTWVTESMFSLTHLTLREQPRTIFICISVACYGWLRFWALRMSCKFRSPRGPVNFALLCRDIANLLFSQTHLVSARRPAKTSEILAGKHKIYAQIFQMEYISSHVWRIALSKWTSTEEISKWLCYRSWSMEWEIASMQMWCLVTGRKILRRAPKLYPQSQPFFLTHQSSRRILIISDISP